MTRSEFFQVNDRPCRFKLKSGKEVFGVIYEKTSENKTLYYFASLGERFGSSRNKGSIGMAIELDEIVGAELINSSMVG